MNRTIIIAEAGVNHNGDLELAKQLILVAAESGADYVKFQTFDADQLVTKNATLAEYQKKNSAVDKSQYEMIKRLELKREHHDLLIKYASKHKIKFLSSAFDIGGLEFLNSLGLDKFKIPSGEITNYQYLKKAASFGKEIILSTGMATVADIDSAISVLIRFGCARDKITLLQCTTEYPAPMHQVNLLAIRSLREVFGVNVGYSDHTVGIEISIAAVALGATVIEKHFTLNRGMAGPDHKASLEPNELREMILAIRNVEEALGDGVKTVEKCEYKNSLVARKSLVATQKINKGEIFTSSNIGAKRPGTGISPMRYEEALGRIANKNFNVDDLVEF